MFFCLFLKKRLAAGRGADGAKAGGRRGSRRHAWRQAAAAQLPALPVEAAANLLLARAGFDLLRSVDFKQRVAAHVQRKLGQLRVPEYIHSLEVGLETHFPPNPRMCGARQASTHV